MASGQIRMTPDTMRERAGEYRTEADNVQSVIDKIQYHEPAQIRGHGYQQVCRAQTFICKGKLIDEHRNMHFDKTCEAESTDTQIANQFSM